MNIIENIQNNYKKELEEVENIILNASSTDINDLTDSLAVNVTSALKKGKYVRPLIVLTLGGMFRGDKKQYIKLAAAAELIHIATLLHDDVVDNSDLRRGYYTANTLFNNKTSILVGDYILGQAFNLLIDLKNIEILSIMVNCTTNMARGELAQMNMNGNYSITLDDYIKMISEKTGLLFAAISHATAILSGQQNPEQFTKFGINLGIAFQIIDDTMDYCCQPKQTKKGIGNDFRNGYVTLPAILAMFEASDEEEDFWIKSFSNPNLRTDAGFAKAKEYVDKHNSIIKSIEMAKMHTSISAESLQKFSSTDEYRAVQELLQFIVDRKY